MRARWIGAREILRHSDTEVRGRRHVMILGLGNDIIDIRRVERTIERYGDRFLSRVFTDIERRKSDGRGRAPPPTPSASPPRRLAPRPWAPASARGVLARHGRRQSALRPAYP